MRNKLIITFMALTCYSTSFALNFGGFSAVTVFGEGGGELPAGSSSYLVVDTGGLGFDFVSGTGPFSMNTGLVFEAGEFVTGTDDYVITYNASQDLGPAAISGNANFNLTDATGLSGASFALIFFDGETDAVLTTQNSTNFGFYTDSSWVVPTANNASRNFAADYTQLTSIGTNGTVVPEPSAFALLAGCFGLAWVMVRRRV